MRVLLRALAVGALAAATACNVTPQEVSVPPPATSSGGAAGASTTTGGSGSHTNGGNGGSVAGNTAGNTAGNNGGGSTSGGAAGGSSGGTTGLSDAGPAPVPNSIEFVGTTNAFLGVDYQAAYSINPINTFNFRVATTTDGGVPGIAVTFTPGAANANGSSLLDANNNPATSVTGVTNGVGSASVQLQAGTQAGEVTVLATITLPGATSSVTGTSSVVGTQPSVSNSGMSCTPFNLPVYSGGDNPVCAEKSTYAGTTTCTVNLGDRFGNAIDIAVPVHFYAEAGLWQSQTVNTPAYGASSTTAPAGKAVNTLETQGATLPVDVPPLADEPSNSGLCLNTIQRTYNPRDGLVTVMAAFTGEESFPPTSTGSWEPGDQFIDLPQPFVDNDDSSVWKAGDICAGTSTNGVCDGPNHMWDGNANVWVENWILYSGDPVTTVWSPATGPNVGSLAVTGQVTWADVNLNAPASQTTCIVSAPSSGEPQGFSCTYPAGTSLASPPDSYAGMTTAQLETCDAGYIILPDGGQQVNQICSNLTVVTGFTSGFTGTYQLTDSSTTMGGQYCINSSCKIFSDGPDISQLCGTAQ